MSERQKAYRAWRGTAEEVMELTALRVYHNGEARRWDRAAQVADQQKQTLMYRRYRSRAARHRRWARLLAQIAQS